MLDTGRYFPCARDWLVKASAESLRRIRVDRGKAPERIAPLLAYLEQNVFDPSLDSEQLRHACQVRDHKTTTLFHQVVGTPPGAYIRERRMETASALLIQSPLEIWMVAELVGYASIQAFGRAFKRWSEVTPSKYRAQERAEVEKADKLPSSSRLNEETVRQALAGGLEDREAIVLVQQLADLYDSDLAASESTGAGECRST